MSLKFVTLVLLTTTTSLQACGWGSGAVGDPANVHIEVDHHAQITSAESKNPDASYEVVKFGQINSGEMIDELSFPDENAGDHGVTAFRDPVKNNMWHHGWTPAPSEMKDWDQWFDDFNNKFNESVINIMDPKDLDKLNAERGSASGWPQRWKDAGVGFPGGEPPPWAYAPKNVGKSRFCFLPPQIGTCQKGQTPDDPGLRFAYNPYKDACVPFQYSGCGGNNNQFHSKTICEDQCIAIVPNNGCDPESQIYIDDTVAAKK